VTAPLRRKIAKVIAYGLASLVALIAIVVLGAMGVVQGERLAKIVNGVLPEQRGKMHFGAIYWKPRLLYDLVADRATPMVVEGLTITDPEGTVVLDVPHLEVSVRLKALIGGAGIILSDLRVGPDSIWRFSKMAKQPGIGFLSAFDPKNPAPPPPPRPPGAKKEKGFVFQIVNAELNGFRAIFDFPGAWGLDLRDIHAPASVLVDGEGFVGWDVTKLEARQGGYLKILTEVLPFDRVAVDRVATTRAWPDDIFLDLPSARTGRTNLSGKGFFTGIYGANSVSGIKIHAEFEHAADALTAVAAPHGIAGLHLSGDNAKVVGDLWDPYDTLKIKAAINGLDVGYQTYRAQQLAVRAGIVFATTAPTMTLTLDELSLRSPSGGKFSTAMTMAGDDISAKLTFDHFATDDYVPADMRKLAAGKMHGHMSVAANIGDKKSVRLRDLDLRYDRSFKQTAIPQSVHLTGQAQASSEVVSTSGLHIVVPGATAEITGKVELAKRLLDLSLRVATSDLPRVLSTMKVGPLAKSAGVAVDVTGSLDRPSAKGRIDVNDIGGGSSGIPAIAKFQTGFHLRDGTLTVESLHAGVAGGSLDGSGSAKLFEDTIAHMLATPVLDFRIDGKQLSLQELITSGVVSGRVSFTLVATGTAKKPKVHFQVPAGTTVEVLGQAWRIEGIDVEADKDQLAVRLCHVAGKAGGEVEIVGTIQLDRKPLAMDWHIKLRDLPIATLLASAKVDAPASGRLTVDLHVSGTLQVPKVEGTIALANVKAFGIQLGDASLALAPTADGGVAVNGNLFHRLNIDARGGYSAAGVHAKAALSFEHLRVEDILPELKAQGIAAALSGRVNLDLRPGQLPAIDAVLSELDTSLTRDIAQEGGGTTQEKIWLKNANPLHLVTDTEKVVLDEVRLVTKGGEFTLAAQVQPLKNGDGEVTDRAVKADMDGQLDLGILQPLLAGDLASLRGGIGLKVHVGGSVKQPDLRGEIAITSPVRAEARAFDQVVAIPSGTLRLTSSSVVLSELAITIADATLKLGGRVDLGPGFSPTTLALKAEGDVSATLLESLAPSAVSDVKGKASISASISGKVDDPQIAARISLGEIQMRLRGINGKVAVQSGTVELSSHELLLRDVRVHLNDEGELLIGAAGSRPGRVRIRSLRPEFQWEAIDLPLQGNRLGYRDQSIEVDDLSLAMQLTGTPSDGLTLAGDVRLISGRYIQDFNVRNLVISPRINESTSRPFWQGEPLLQDLTLALRVRTEGNGFVVHNNLAPEIYIVIDIGIGGTLSSPTISGEIRPTDGRFHIIGLRGDFELSPNVNHVTFVPTKSIAAGDTPELNLEAQNTVLDGAGTEHVVLMRISGPINRATIDLSTTDGLDRNQTMLLLLAGRTTDDLSGNTGQVFGMNRQSGLDMLGQVSRDAVSNLVEPYIDDTLQILTGRKWDLRPTIGADGAEIKIQARATREFDLELSYLQGFQNQNRYRGQLLTWFRDYLTGRVIGERLTYSLQQGIPMQTSSFRLELTFEYPLRIPIP
jgi:autotransporter translocation and assembly factor TamB